MPSSSAGCGNEGQIKLVSEMCARKKSQARPNPRWRNLVSPINRCGQFASGAVCPLSTIACWTVSAEGFCAREVASLLLARVIVCLVPQCNHFRGSRETSAAQELHTLRVVRSKKSLLTGGG